MDFLYGIRAAAEAHAAFLRGARRFPQQATGAFSRPPAVVRVLSVRWTRNRPRRDGKRGQHLLDETAEFTMPRIRAARR